MPRAAVLAGRPTLDDEIAGLRGLDVKGLQARWKSVSGRDAPPGLPPRLMFAVLAYRIQADSLGDLDAECARLLKKVESAQSKTDVIQLSNGFDRQRRELLPGTVLAREWAGQARRVMVVQDGFAFEGKTYDSLSKIAFAITGTKWNGPRFFGLRGNSSAAVPE